VDSGIVSEVDVDPVDPAAPPGAAAGSLDAGEEHAVATSASASASAAQRASS
jgi:hypothetical protein